MGAFDLKRLLPRGQHEAGLHGNSLAVLLIATNRYVEFFSQFYDSAKTFFLPSTAKTFFVLTDRTTDRSLADRPDVVAVHIPHEAWPRPTLFKFKYFLGIRDRLLAFTHIIALDVDTRFCATISERDFFSHGRPLFVVRHPGYFWPWSRGDFERNPDSIACVRPGDNLCTYLAGALWGGKTANALVMMQELARRIDDDLSRGVIAKWWDESHLNKYFAEQHRKVHYFSPGYMCPESWLLPFKKRLLALDKNHAAMRGTA